MKTQLSLLFILLTILTVNGFSNNNEQTEEKVLKPNYDFNIFKLYALNPVKTESDSTLLFKTNTILKRKED